MNANRMDDAARAGWLYYIAGNTQDEIAAAMGISRQTAQRLVTLAVTERLIKVWLDHPIAACMELAERLRRTYRLRSAEIVPSGGGRNGASGIAQAGAAEILRWLRRDAPIVMAVGTGRTLRAVVDNLQPLTCPQHRIVSLTGNIGPDGSAAFYNVIYSMADAIKAPHFPFPLPVYLASAEERSLMLDQTVISRSFRLAAAADVAFVGIGEMTATAPLFVDGFLTGDELRAVQEAGGVGEICGLIFDADGRPLPGSPNDRIASAPLPDRDSATVIALASGAGKLPALRAALRGGLINGVITDEAMAEALLIEP